MWGILRQHLRRGHVLVRLAMCAVAALTLWGITRGWAPPQHFHLGDVPERDVTARVSFDQLDLQATDDARKQARKLAVAIYEQDATPLEQLQAKLVNEVSQLVATDDLKTVSAVWDEFRLPLAEGTPEPTAEERQQQFTKFREALTGEGALDTFKSTIAEVFKPLQQNGLLDALPRRLRRQRAKDRRAAQGSARL